MSASTSASSSPAWRLQNHARRAELNLQISLLAEHEVTRLIEMVSDIGKLMGAPSAARPELTELKKDIKPEAVLDHIEKTQNETSSP